jgi:hypothetical protein
MIAKILFGTCIYIYIPTHTHTHIHTHTHTYTQTLHVHTHRFAHSRQESGAHETMWKAIIFATPDIHAVCVDASRYLSQNGRLFGYVYTLYNQTLSKGRSTRCARSLAYTQKHKYTCIYIYCAEISLRTKSIRYPATYSKAARSRSIICEFRLINLCVCSRVQALILACVEVLMTFV